jgi:hypothetical protein
VVKIPHRPITDFSVYSEAIRKERAIVEKLAPRECIIPKVSVILKRIRKFQDEHTTDPTKIEDRYSRWVANSAEAQSFLKIGGGFVFFMDLSQYVFLGYTIVELHDIKAKAVAEIYGNPTLIWDAQGFSGRYGQGSSLGRRNQNARPTDAKATAIDGRIRALCRGLRVEGLP